MKAIAVLPGTAGSIHLRDAPMPSVEEIPEGRGVLVQVLRVGVDGTDKEINAASLEAAVRIIEGTARSMGVEIVG